MWFVMVQKRTTCSAFIIDLFIFIVGGSIHFLTLPPFLSLNRALAPYS